MDTKDSNTPTAADMLNLFTAENLLVGTPIFEQVIKLRDSLSRNSDGTFISYDDMFTRIRAEVDELPALELQMDIPAGQEGAYQRQLLHALAETNDQHDKVLRKVVKLQSRLLNAIHLMKMQRAQFAAFYSLSIPVAVHATTIPALKLSAPQIKEMAAAEYSNLMDRLDYLAPSLISELTLLEGEIKQRKQAQAATYALGKDQVNAMWDSIQSAGGGIGLDDDNGALLKKGFAVDDLDDAPSYVSKHSRETRIGANASLITPLKTRCTKCGEMQFNTPSGATCSNGHGGDPGLDEGEEWFPIKGTFVKILESKPLLTIRDDEGTEVQFTMDEVATLRSQLDAAQTDPDYKVVYHHGEKEECPACEAISEGFGDIGDSHTIGVYALPETLSQEEATESMDEGLIGERHEVTFDPPKAASLTPDPQPSAKELLTEEVAIEDVDDDPFPGTPEDAADLLDTLEGIAQEMKEGIPQDDDDLDLPQPLVVDEERIANDPLVKHLREFAAKYADEEEGPTPVESERIILPEGATIVEDIDILNEPEPLATAAPTTPRKKLILLADEELF